MNKDMLTIIASLVTAFFGILTLLIDKNKPEFALWFLIIIVLGVSINIILVLLPQNGSRKNKEEIKDLFTIEKHPLFNRLEYFVQVVIPGIQIEHPVKCKMVRKFLMIQFEVFRNGILDQIHSVNQTPEKFCESQGEIFLNLISECEMKALHDGIPKIFLDKFAGWNSIHIKAAFDAISRIAESNLYKDCQDKLYAVLDFYLYAFTMSVLSAERTLNHMNGELEKHLENF